MKRKQRFATDFLFSTPTFLSGAGTVINLAGNYYDFNASDSGSEADVLALSNDFRMVGQDLADVLEVVRDEKQMLSTF